MTLRTADEAWKRLLICSLFFIHSKVNFRGMHDFCLFRTLMGKNIGESGSFTVERYPYEEEIPCIRVSFESIGTLMKRKHLA